MKTIIIILVLTVPFALTTNVCIADESQSAPHGVIKYRLVEVKNNKTLSEQTLYLKNINIANRPISNTSGKYFEDRYIGIYDDFIIGLNNYGYKEKVIGFGILLKRLNKDTFSWEWYNQIDTNTFEKLQGAGQLQVEFKQRGDYWEISKMTFIGDHKLRAKIFGLISGLSSFLLKDFREDWHCIILDGSYIIW